jgi:hypothetical protein
MSPAAAESGSYQASSDWRITAAFAAVWMVAAAAFLTAMAIFGVSWSDEPRPPSLADVVSAFAWPATLTLAALASGLYAFRPSRSRARLAAALTLLGALPIVVLLLS